MRPLTNRQAEILALIQDFMEEAGFPPTRAEIAAKLGFRSVRALLRRLSLQPFWIVYSLIRARMAGAASPLTLPRMARSGAASTPRRWTLS